MFSYTYIKIGSADSAESLAAIGLSPTAIQANAASAVFYFPAALSEFEKGNLDMAMADRGFNFSTSAETSTGEKDLAIYNYISDKNVAKNKVPKDQDYGVLGLYKKNTLVDGDLVRVEYFGAFDGQDFSLPVVREDRVYTFNSGIFVRRDMTITWFYSDGTDCADVKTTVKHYDGLAGMRSIHAKMKNILSSAQMNLMIYLIASGQAADLAAAQAIGKEFMRSFPAEMSLFTEGDRAPLVDFLTADTAHAFLDATVPPSGQTIRSLLIAEVG